MSAWAGAGRVVSRPQARLVGLTVSAERRELHQCCADSASEIGHLIDQAAQVIGKIVPHAFLAFTTAQVRAVETMRGVGVIVTF